MKYLILWLFAIVFGTGIIIVSILVPALYVIAVIGVLLVCFGFFNLFFNDFDF